jgi:hypothetical protein
MNSTDHRRDGRIICMLLFLAFFVAGISAGLQATDPGYGFGMLPTAEAAPIVTPTAPTRLRDVGLIDQTDDYNQIVHKEPGSTGVSLFGTPAWRPSNGISTLTYSFIVDATCRIRVFIIDSEGEEEYADLEGGDLSAHVQYTGTFRVYDPFTYRFEVVGSANVTGGFEEVAGGVN